ncbi:hypothetical protein [Pedobacter sp.]|uniref:hypothetical protein n=1 Tax=Pedobacter sp. TaxID=1411316 RepID=UPI00396CC9DC
MKKILFTLLVGTVLMVSCKEKKQGKGLDYNKIKSELTLTAEQSKQFDEIAEKYKKLSAEARTASGGEGAQFDRIGFLTKLEALRKQQSKEMSAFLSHEDLIKFNTYVDKNSRKRPRYTDELLAQLKTELALNDQQYQTLEAVNNAFEKSFSDAHDVYHGNNGLAREYWFKYDDQRKEALKKVFNDEQFAKYQEIVKAVEPPFEDKK